ncbi:MAG: hypothetical protein WCS15_10405 [Prevotella sp.]
MTKLEMRELRGDDLFTVLGILGKLDVKDEIVNMFNGGDGKVTKLEDHKKKQDEVANMVEQRGMAIMAGIMQKALLNIGKVKTDVNGLLADLCGVKVKDIQDLSLVEYTALLIKLFKKPELKGFFGSISSLLA